MSEGEDQGRDKDDDGLVTREEVWAPWVSSRSWGRRTSR